MRSGKNGWACFLLCLAGVVLGGFAGSLAENTPVLAWLNYGQSFGLDNPIVLNLGILVVTFAFTIQITVAGIFGLIIGILIYKKL